MSEQHWSKSLNQGLEAFNEGLSYLNPIDLIGRVAASNTDYKASALNNQYTPQGDVKRTVVDHILGTSPQTIQREQQRQIEEYIDDSDTEFGVRAEDYGIETKRSDGKYRKLKDIGNAIDKGDARSKDLPAGLLPTDIALPDGKSIATATESVFQKGLRNATTLLNNKSKASAAGVTLADPTNTAEVNNAVRIKENEDEIDKQRGLDTYTEGSAAGIRNQANHDKQIEVQQQNIDASKASTLLARDTHNLSTQIENRNLDQINYKNKRHDWEYGDAKQERSTQRQYDASREDAQFAANVETIKLQNAAEMERYEMMLDNDKEVRQGESISDLMSALTMLGGAFMV